METQSTNYLQNMSECEDRWQWNCQIKADDDWLNKRISIRMDRLEAEKRNRDGQTLIEMIEEDIERCKKIKKQNEKEVVYE